MSLIKRFERNTAGRDFAVGDIHGHFTRLQAALDAIGFDPAVDRLFSVGDLVDRGPNIDTLTLGIFEHQYDLEVADVMRIAIERWNDRHNRARSCYDGGEKEGLNIWPRSEA